MLFRLLIIITDTNSVKKLATTQKLMQFLMKYLIMIMMNVLLHKKLIS